MRFDSFRFEIPSWKRRREGGFSGVEAADDVDEGVFEVALLAVELGDAQTVLDHAGEHVGGFGRVFGVDADAAALFAGFEEFDVRLEHAPVGNGVRFAIHLHVVEHAAERVGAAAEGFGITVVDDAAVVDEEQGIAHLTEFGKNVGRDEDGFSLLG